ncbi:MAG TPA: CDP-archaeol synthase [Caulobacteraceae bacterium]|jgi:phosphatidate cytidylyltransferase
MTSSQPARRPAFNWRNLGIRAASAAILGTAAAAAIWAGGWPYFLMVSIAACVLSVEWGGMSTPATPIRTSVAVAVVVVASLFVAELESPRYGMVALAGLTAVATLLLRSVTRHIWDVPFGAAYLGIPAIALLWLRTGEEGLAWTVLLFAVTWSADIAAFAVGNAVKGPKLRPAFSPNKTWSGFFGGLAAATLAGGIAQAALAGLDNPGMHLPVSTGSAMLIGFLGGFATMAGDLWESWLKRRFGVKDSSDLIPGHGGLLDRVDGLLFAAAAVAAARWLWQSGALG